MDEIESMEQPTSNGGNGLALCLAETLEGRDSRGRFVEGNKGGPGNPRARDAHTWRQALADSISPDDVAEVVQRLLEAAKSGKAWAIRELLDRCLGKPTVQIELDTDTPKPPMLTDEERAELFECGRRMMARRIEAQQAKDARPSVQQD